MYKLNLLIAITVAILVGIITILLLVARVALRQRKADLQLRIARNSWTVDAERLLRRSLEPMSETDGLIWLRQLSDVTRSEYRHDCFANLGVCLTWTTREEWQTMFTVAQQRVLKSMGYNAAVDASVLGWI